MSTAGGRCWTSAVAGDTSSACPWRSITSCRYWAFPWHSAGRHSRRIRSSTLTGPHRQPSWVPAWMTTSATRMDLPAQRTPPTPLSASLIPANRLPGARTRSRGTATGSTSSTRSRSVPASDFSWKAPDRRSRVRLILWTTRNIVGGSPSDFRRSRTLSCTTFDRARRRCRRPATASGLEMQLPSCGTVSGWFNGGHRPAEVDSVFRTFRGGLLATLREIEPFCSLVDVLSAWAMLSSLSCPCHRRQRYTGFDGPRTRYLYAGTTVPTGR